MTIYVDELRDYGPKGNFCHMWTDGSIEELHTFAKGLLLNPRWLHESRGISGEFPHYDLVPSKRNKALKHGAVYIPLKQWITEQMQRKAT